MKIITAALFLLLSVNLFASEFYTKVIYEPLESYYPKLKKAIDENHMNILYEMDLIKQFKDEGYSEKFGKDFNKNNLQGVKTLLICNGYVGNQVSNLDPKMMALCPIRLTIIEENKKLTVTFLRHDTIETSKEIKSLLTKLDTILKNTIDLTTDEYMKKANISSYESIHEGN